MKRKKETSPSVGSSGGSRQGKVSLRVNKVRHVFTRNRPARDAAALDREVSGARKAAVKGRSGSSNPKARAIRTLKKKVVAAGSRKGGGKQASGLEALEPEVLAQERKVYRALKKLHIDFKEDKSGPSPLARTSSNITVTRNIKRQSKGIGTAAAAGEAEDPSKDGAASDVSVSSAPGGRRKSGHAGLLKQNQETVPVEETSHASRTAAVQSDTAAGTSGSRSGTASKSAPTEDATLDASGGIVKKNIAKPKRGRPPKLISKTDSTSVSRSGAASKSVPAEDAASDASAGSVQKSVANSKRGRPPKHVPKTSPVRSSVSKADMFSILPKMSKRFSTSVYSSRRISSSGASTPQPAENVPEPMDLDEDSGGDEQDSIVSEELANSSDVGSSRKESKHFHLKKGETAFKKGRGPYRGATTGFQKGRGTSRGIYSGTTFANVLSRGRGRGLSVSALNSRSSTKVSYQGRLRKRQKWTHQKGPGHHSGSTRGKLSEPEEKPSEKDGDGSAKAENEPPSKRARLKNVQASPANADTEEEEDLSTDGEGERRDPARQKPNPTKSKPIMQPPLVKKATSGSVAAGETAAPKPKVATPKMLKNRAFKAGSRSVESALRDRGSLLRKSRYAAHSRSSSPGGTEMRLKSRGASTAAELSRSSSLDNLLCKTDSPSALRTTRNRGGIVGKSSDNVNQKTESEADVLGSSASAVTATKRRQSASPSARSGKGGEAAAKRRRLLTRLRDSSTFQMPNILFSCRTSRALGDSPTASRESSPGSLPRLKRQRSAEHAESAHLPMDTGSQNAKEERASFSKTDEKKAVQSCVDSKHSKDKQLTNSAPSKSETASDKNKVPETKDDVKGRGRGRLKPLVKSQSEEGDRISQSKEELSDDDCDGSQPSEPGQQTAGPADEAAGQSLSAGTEGTKRGPGRPKGATKKKFRLYVAKRHVTGMKERVTKSEMHTKQLQFASSLQNPLKPGENLPVKRGRGRPRKIHPQLESSQTMEESPQSMNNNSEKSTGASVSPSVTDKRLLMKKHVLGRPPLKASHLGKDTKPLSTIRMVEDPKMVTVAQLKKKYGRPRKKPLTAAELDLSKRSAHSPQDTAADRLSSASDFSHEQRSKGRSSDNSSTLQNLVRMRRESRRQLKKSRWATGKLPKQSLAALSSAAKFKKRSDDDVHSTCESRKPGEEVSEMVPDSCPRLDVVGHSKMETTEVPPDQSESVPSASLDATCTEQASDDVKAAAFESSSGEVSSLERVKKDSSESTSDVPSLKGASLADPVKEDPSLPVSDRKSLPSADDPRQTPQDAATTSTEGDQPQPLCDSLPVKKPALEDQKHYKPDPAETSFDRSQVAEPIPVTELSTKDQPEDGLAADEKPSAGVQSEELRPCDRPEEPPILEPAESSTLGQVEETSRCDHSEEPDQVEKAPAHDPSNEPPMREQTENPLVSGETENLPVGDKSEEPSVEHQMVSPVDGEQPSESGQTEPSVGEQTHPSPLEPSVGALTEGATVGDHAELPGSDQSEQPSVGAETEASGGDRTEEPSVGDQKEELTVGVETGPSVGGQREESPVAVETGPSVGGQTEESPVAVETGPSVGGQTEEPTEGCEAGQSAAVGTEEPRVDGQTAPSVANPTDDPCQAETSVGQVKPNAPVESVTKAQHSHDTSGSTEPSVDDPSQSMCDASSQSVEGQGTVVTPDLCQQVDEEGAPRTPTDHDNSTRTDAASSQLPVNEDNAGQQSEAKLSAPAKPPEDDQQQGVSSEMLPVSETSSSMKMETCDSKPLFTLTKLLTLTKLDTTKDSSESALSSPAQLQGTESSINADPVKKAEREGAEDVPDSSPGCANPETTEMDKQGSSGAEQTSAEEPNTPSSSDAGLPMTDNRLDRRIPVVPIAKRKQNAISRELKRLQTDEGAQRIMSWREKKKWKSQDKLLRSKIKEDKDELQKYEEQKEQRQKLQSSKLYSIDAISDTRLLFKSGKSVKPPTVSEHIQEAESVHDPEYQIHQDSTLLSVPEGSGRLKRGLLSVSSSVDSEDAPPPDITEMPPYKDSRSERCRSEELSPPPLIRPEDLFSEEYYESMLVTSASQCHGRKNTTAEAVAVRSESGMTTPYRRHAMDSIFSQADGADIDTPQGNESLGGLSSVPLNITTKLGPRKKRGRGKRKSAKIDAAYKMGHIFRDRPGPASSKIGRRTSSSPKQDPTYSHHMPHLPSEPRTFGLRPKTTRSPIEIIAMRQKLEEEAYELEEATRVARKLKRRQALFGKLGMTSDSYPHCSAESCKPCSVVLVDFVKELHLNSIDTPDQYISDVSFDSDEEDVDDDENDYEDELYSYQSDENVLGIQSLPVMELRKADVKVKDSLRETSGLMATSEAVWKGSGESVHRTTETQQTLVGVSSSSPEAKKAGPDLESLKGKGFMGNFVDFIQNRSSQSSPSMKPRPRGRPKTPVSFGGLTVSQTSPASVDTSWVSCTSDSAGTPPSTTVATLSSAVVLSAGPHSEIMTSAQMHTPRQGQVGKGDHNIISAENATVSSSPSRAVDSKNVPTAEKMQYSPHHYGMVKCSAEKGGYPGKLKVFPTRKENEGVPADRATFTRYLCTKCEFSATNKGTIESHIYRHIPGVTFKCGYCESEFTGLISALTHVKNIHNSKEPKVWISKDINEASLYTEEEIPSCPGAVVASPHSSQHGAGGADSADLSASPLVQEGQPVIISLVVSGDRQVQRPERFSSSPLATQRRFACTHCSYCTNVKEDAHQHVRDLHSDSSLFTCYLCDKAFGCSYQDIVAHCRATHPDRPKSFNKLPDFYDQELVRVNAGSGDRSKSSEDRGNIFDRMSNFFPNLGPGSELMEDGQLSPQARFLRARDYLYIQEGWSRKTSAEADSTTIEDIEIPFEDATDADSSTLHSTCGEQVSGQQVVEADDGVPGSSTGVEDSFDPAAFPASQTAGSQKTCNRAGSSHASEQTAVGYNNQNSADKSAIGSLSAEGGHSQVPAFQNASKTTENASSSSLPESIKHSAQASCPPADKDQRVIRDGSNTVPDVGLATVTGREDMAGGSGDTTRNVSAEHLSTGSSMLAGSSGDHVTSPTKENKSSLSTEESEAEKGCRKTMAQLAQEPVLSEAECDDDGENDILVIDLGADVEDMADDTSHSSSPREERVELSCPESDARSVEKGAASFGSQGRGVPDGGARARASSADQGQSTSGEAELCAAKSAASADNSADDSMGIKILSVVSLSDRGDQGAADLSLSPSKSRSGSEPSSSPQTPSGGRVKKSSPVTPKSSPRGFRRKSSSSSKHLPEVDADDMATRNEKMVCTYKCHTCSIHSPALAAIVEHLKHHHHHVPLFSCPYCKAKKESFFTEEMVHNHVSNHHPSNYAKNEVSLSEIAKSFVQVLALPSGNRRRSSLIEEDIYMCLQCQSHVPDLDYALRHLKEEHPGVLKYACPVCGTFSNSLQDVVKKHMLQAHGQAPDSVQLALAMEGVYLTKVTCISVNGQYVDHAPNTPPKPAAASDLAPGSSHKKDAALKAAAPSSGPAQPFPVAGFGVGPLGVLPVPLTQASPLALTALQGQASFPGPLVAGRSSKQKTKNLLDSSQQRPRQILPLPGSAVGSTLMPPRQGDSAVANFHLTGVTVKDILDTRQKTLSSGPFPLALDANILAALSSSVPTSSGEQLEADSLTPRGIFSMMNMLGLSHCSPNPSVSTTCASSSSVPSPSRPVLKVPNVSSVLDLTSSRCLSVDTGTSVNTLLSPGALSASTTAVSSASPMKHTTSLSFPLGTLTSPVPALSSLSTQASLSLPMSPREREDPEAFKIFNLKPRTPAPQSPRPSSSPAPSAHKTSSSLPPPASPRMTQATALTSAAVTVASSALFPQQFPVTQFPSLQPAGIATLPLAQGGLPLAQNLPLPVRAGLPLNPGLAVPLNVNPAQLLMAPNNFPPVLVPASLLPQLGVRAPVPQLSVVSGAAPAPAPPPAHQPVSDVQTAPVNLSLMQPGFPVVSAAPPQSPKPGLSKSPTPSSPVPPKLSRSRGRPKLHKDKDLAPRPRIPVSAAPRFFAPASLSSSATQPAGGDAPQPCPAPLPSRQPDAKGPSPKPQRHSSSHQCVCPYCTETLILKPWEVAQHIKMTHPGKEIKYNRVLSFVPSEDKRL